MDYTICNKEINFYWDNTNLSDALTNYHPEDKYIVFKPWNGGPNNVRMSLEIAAGIAFLLNRILVIPTQFYTDHLKNQNSIHLLFDVIDLGIETVSLDKFKEKNNINSWKEIEDISYTLNKELVNVLLTTDSPEESIIKGRELLDLNELKDKNIIYFNGNLLGNFYLNIYSNRNSELCKFVARHIHFPKSVFYEAYKAAKLLQKYSAIHIRRGDFQYSRKDIVIPAEQIYNNIKNVIPSGSTLYISTNETDKLFFSIFEENYQVKYFDDIKNILSNNIDPELIGSVEQAICANADLFIGTKLSTFSTYIYRLRGYMNKEDKRFLTYNVECYPDKEEDYWWDSTWTREYSQGWESIND
jgi:hypothetical protein